MGIRILRFAAPFTIAWVLVGMALGIGAGIWTGARNGFESFVDALILNIVLAVTFGGLFAGCGLVVGVLWGALRALRERELGRRAGELGFASAVATLGAIYALRWFEFEAAYPRVYPFVDGWGGMVGVAAVILAGVGALAMGTAAGLAAGAAHLRARGVAVRFPWSAGALIGWLVLGSAGASLVAGRGSPPPLATATDSEPSMIDLAVTLPSSKILLVGCDGADWNVIDQLIAQGELPTLGRLLARGARASMETIEGHPSPALWTSIATSKTPRTHGILDFYVQTVAGTDTPISIFPRHLGLNSGLLLHDLGGDRLVRVAPVHSRMVQARRVWEILSDHGASVGVVNWLVTWPPEPGPTFVVTDRTFAAAIRAKDEGRLPSRHDEGTQTPLWDPPEIDGVVQRTIDTPGVLDHEDELVGAMSLALYDRYRPQVLVAYCRDVDAAEHLHWDDFEPQYFPGGGEGDPATSAIPEAYRRFDRVLGTLVETVGSDATILVVSDHGHAPWFTWLGRGTPGGHTNAPAGVFLAAGPGIVPGRLAEPISVYDVTPTLLRLVGLPPAADMEGRVLHEILDEEAIRPATIIASYETGREGQGELLPGAGDEALFENLRSLGYIR